MNFHISYGIWGLSLIKIGFATNFVSSVVFACPACPGRELAEWVSCVSFGTSVSDSSFVFSNNLTSSSFEFSVLSFKFLVGFSPTIDTTETGAVFLLGIR